MIYPKIELAQLIVNACEHHKIETVVISPGSRNAPLIIGFHNNKKINALSIVDERSAAFFALGIAQQTQKPVGLVCTSGSALLNYYPAIAEAYFSNIPLIILSADRPKHLLNIGDGQTINQKNVFKNHILMSVDLQENTLKNNYTKQNFNIVNKAFEKAISQKGPIHINIPFNEPLYETTLNGIDFPNIQPNLSQNILTEKPLDVDELSKFATLWNNSKKKMVLIGVNYPSELLQTQINKLIQDPSVLVLTETTSNIYHKNLINGIDKLISPLSEKEKEDLKPEILLTFGGMVVSKKIKQFLRTYQPKHHWHIDPKTSLDTYHCLLHHFKISIELFFSQFFFLTKEQKSSYQDYYLALQKQRNLLQKDYLKNIPFSDLKVFDTLIKAIPKKYQIQFSNSSIIRYSQLFNTDKSHHIFCNRGTSGIDGSTSTAIGASYASKQKTLFVTGDISFFYDSNAFWNNYIKPDLRIIIINNSGGGIFRFIPGPQSSNALNYFETPHQLNAKNVCLMHGLNYKKATNIEELNKQLHAFFNKSTKAKVLEIFTPKDKNDPVLKEYFSYLKG